MDSFRNMDHWLKTEDEEYAASNADAFGDEGRYHLSICAAKQELLRAQLRDQYRELSDREVRSITRNALMRNLGVKYALE